MAELGNNIKYCFLAFLNVAEKFVVVWVGSGGVVEHMATMSNLNQNKNELVLTIFISDCSQ